MPYDLWIPLGGTLTLLGLIASWIVWRRRGAAAGMRLAAWSLLPLAAALIGVLRVIWNVGATLIGFFTGLVFSPLVWIGVVVAGVAVVLWVVSGVLRARGGGASVDPASKAGAVSGAGTKPISGGPAAQKTTAGGKSAPAADDDLGDIEEILKRRGIS